MTTLRCTALHCSLDYACAFVLAFEQTGKTACRLLLAQNQMMLCNMICKASTAVQYYSITTQLFPAQCIPILYHAGALTILKINATHDVSPMQCKLTEFSRCCKSKIWSSEQFTMGLCSNKADAYTLLLQSIFSTRFSWAYAALISCQQTTMLLKMSACA